MIYHTASVCNTYNNDIDEATAIFSDVVEHFRRDPILFLESLNIIFERLVLLHKQNQSIPVVLDSYDSILDILLPYLKDSSIEFKRKYIEISYTHSDDLRIIHRDPIAQQKRVDLVERVYRDVNLYF
ncbi:MAG: hypothetical protein CL600_14520 [Alteromonas sp.]|nr:hypothetical protein [Alteromonas sp.]